MGLFSSIFDFAKTAIPSVIGYAVGGPTGAAVGGALGGLASGDGLKGAAIGGITGYLGGSALQSAGGFSGLFSGGGNLLSSLGKLTGGNNLLSLANLGSNLYSGIAGSSAARSASGQLQAAAQRGINAQKSQLRNNNANVAPYLGAGAAGASTLQGLVTDPNAQRAFIQNNPFYQQLATDAKNQIFSNAAATGKLGSGGTAAALQDRLLSLGESLLGQRIGQAQDLANLGANTASNLNSTNTGVTNQISELLTDQGSAQASGTVGSQNAINQAIQSFMTTQGQIAGLKI
jgi:hypothetical protein